MSYSSLWQRWALSLLFEHTIMWYFSAFLITRCTYTLKGLFHTKFPFAILYAIFLSPGLMPRTMITQMLEEGGLCGSMGFTSHWLELHKLMFIFFFHTQYLALYNSSIIIAKWTRNISLFSVQSYNISPLNIKQLFSTIQRIPI